jgi:hypothetical protein
LGHAEDVGYDLIRSQQEISVEGVNDTQFGLAEVAGARHATHHEEIEVMCANGSRPIDNFANLVVVTKGLAH